MAKLQYSNELFKKYEKLIFKAVHTTAFNHQMDKEELTGKAFTLFLKAIDSYDEKKGLFSTHLTWNLRNLFAHVKQEKKHSLLLSDFLESPSGEQTSSVGTMFKEALSEIDLNYERTELLHSIATSLSTNSQLYLKDLFNGRYQEIKQEHGGRPVGFSIDVNSVIRKNYNWSRKEALSVKHEITQFWKSYQEVA